MKIEYLIQKLVEEVVLYKSTVDSDEVALDSFLYFLKEKNGFVPIKQILKREDYNMDQEIIVHIGRLYRYAHSYLKTSLSETNFSTDMDFAFTAILHQYGSMSKMDLIRKMVYEKSSGMEIIKRLIKKGIIKQAENPKDKRSKLLELTEKGRLEIFKAYEKASPAAKTVSLPLSENEKVILLNLLSKLDNFHLDYYLDSETNPVNIISDRSEL